MQYDPQLKSLAAREARLTLGDAEDAAWNREHFADFLRYREARQTFSVLLSRVARDPLRARGATLLVLGDFDFGRAHLLRALRRQVHHRAHGFFCLTRLVGRLDQHGRVLLADAIASLDEPYAAAVGQASSLQKISDALADDPALTDPDLLAAFRRTESEDESRRLVNRLSTRLYLASSRFQSIDPDLVKALLFLQKNDAGVHALVLRYLQCEMLGSLDRHMLGDIVPRLADEHPLATMVELGKLVWVLFEAPLVVAVDQSEENVMSHGFRRALRWVNELTERVRSSIAVFGCREETYEEVRGELSPQTIRDLEEDPAPLHLDRGAERATPTSRPQEQDAREDQLRLVRNRLALLNRAFAGQDGEGLPLDLPEEELRKIAGRIAVPQPARRQPEAAVFPRVELSPAAPAADLEQLHDEADRPASFVGSVYHGNGEDAGESFDLELTEQDLIVQEALDAGPVADAAVSAWQAPDLAEAQSAAAGAEAESTPEAANQPPAVQDGSELDVEWPVEPIASDLELDIPAPVIDATPAAVVHDAADAAPEPAEAPEETAEFEPLTALEEAILEVADGDVAEVGELATMDVSALAPAVPAAEPPQADEDAFDLGDFWLDDPDLEEEGELIEACEVSMPSSDPVLAGLIAEGILAQGTSFDTDDSHDRVVAELNATSDPTEVDLSALMLTLPAAAAADGAAPEPVDAATVAVARDLLGHTPARSRAVIRLNEEWIAHRKKSRAKAPVAEAARVELIAWALKACAGELPRDVTIEVANSGADCDVTLRIGRESECVRVALCEEGLKNGMLMRRVRRIEKQAEGRVVLLRSEGYPEGPHRTGAALRQCDAAGWARFELDEPTWRYLKLVRLFVDANQKKSSLRRWMAAERPLLSLPFLARVFRRAEVRETPEAVVADVVLEAEHEAGATA